MYEYELPPYIAEMFKFNLTKEDIEALRQALIDIVKPIKVMLFVSRDPLRCFSCEDTVKLVKTIADNSPTIGDSKAVELLVYDIFESRDLAIKFNVSKVPTILLLNGSIRYLGMPAGEELRGFVETLIRISNGQHGLSDQVVEEIASLDGEATIDVVVTPPCPYCPYAALLANMFAYVSKVYGDGLVKSRIIEAYENPDIADRYAVTTVPTIAINGRVVFVGLPYEIQLLRAVKKLAKTS